MHKTMRRVAFVACLFAASAALAADPCSEYKWDVSNEVRLFAGKPTALGVATAVEKAPTIVTGTLYALTLQPQEAVNFPVEPSKKMLPDGSFGGLMKFKVDQAGAYRVAIDSGFWLDVVHAGKSLPALDFNGQRQCAGPRKIVVYELPAGVDLTLQVAQASGNKAKLTVTPVAASGK